MITACVMIIGKGTVSLTLSHSLSLSLSPHTQSPPPPPPDQLSQLQLNVVRSVDTLPAVCDTFCLWIDPAVGRWIFRFLSLSLSLTHTLSLSLAISLSLSLFLFLSLFLSVSLSLPPSFSLSPSLSLSFSQSLSLPLSPSLPPHSSTLPSCHRPTITIQSLHSVRHSQPDVHSWNSQLTFDLLLDKELFRHLRWKWVFLPR